MVEASRGQNAVPVVLKKYGNRRLYDTNASKYVTLHDLEEMVQRGTDVQVVDAKSGDDLTKEVLVQIILNKDSAREMLPTSFLKQVVRLSSSPLKETFSRVLQDSLDGFLSNQRSLLDAQRALLSQLPFAGAGAGAGAGLSGMWNPFAPPAPALQYPQAQQQQRDVEVDRLRADMSETQALLRQLISNQTEPPGAAPSGRRAKKKR